MAWNRHQKLKVTVFVVVVLVTTLVSLVVRKGLQLKTKVTKHAAATKRELHLIKPAYGIVDVSLREHHELIVRYLERFWVPFTPWLTSKADADLTTIDTELQGEYAKKYTTTLSPILDIEAKLSHLLGEYEGADSVILSEARNYLATRSADIQEIKGIEVADSVALDKLLLISHELEMQLDRFQSAVLTQRRSEFSDLLATIASDIDSFIPFFKKRAGQEFQIERLVEARTQIATIQKLQPDIEGLNIIEKQVKTELYPLLANAQISRDVILQQEQEEYRRKLADLAKAQTYIPDAPTKEGKVIFVSLATQRLYAYENGVSIFSYPVPVTTGKSNHATVTGEFAIFQKSTDFTMKSPFPDEPYTLFVKYWMPFYSGYGLHDAPWRGSFGGQEFGYNGTHGCVNMREAEVAKLFEWAPIGTKVIVQ